MEEKRINSGYEIKRRQLGIGIGDAHGVLQLLFIYKHQSEPPSSQGHGSLSHR